MSNKKTPPTDHARLLGLLWGSHMAAGRSGLTVKAIVTAAIEIADTQGIDALSMRNVADKLGVGTMSLYTHVPGKTELIALMLDTAYGELYESVETPSEQGGDWRDALRFIARQNWNLYRRHAWMLQVTPVRPAIGPHASLKYEAELRPLDGLGLGDIEMDAALTLILTHVEGCARGLTLWERTQVESGISDAEWWVDLAPMLDKVMEGSHFPVAGRVGQTVGEHFQTAANPEFIFEFGLERILVGIAALIPPKQDV